MGKYKYRLRFHNCIQETDSEERRDVLLRKGYVLENADERSAGTAAIPEEKLREKVHELERALKAASEEAEKKIVLLEKENAELKKENTELKKKAALQEKDVKNKAGLKGLEKELKDA